MINGKQVSYKVIDLFGTNKSILFRSLEGEFKMLDLSWLDIFLNKLHKLIC